MSGLWGPLHAAPESLEMARPCALESGMRTTPIFGITRPGRSARKMSLQAWVIAHSCKAYQDFFTLGLLASSSFSPNSSGGPSSDWKAVFQSRLPLYGHRNWIVVADSEPGIEH